jgi:hypothetical protein
LNEVINLLCRLSVTNGKQFDKKACDCVFRFNDSTVYGFQTTKNWGHQTGNKNQSIKSARFSQEDILRSLGCSRQNVLSN